MIPYFSTDDTGNTFFVLNDLQYCYKLVYKITIFLIFRVKHGKKKKIQKQKKVDERPSNSWLKTFKNKKATIYETLQIKLKPRLIITIE